MHVRLFRSVFIVGQLMLPSVAGTKHTAVRFYHWGASDVEIAEEEEMKHSGSLCRIDFAKCGRHVHVGRRNRYPSTSYSTPFVSISQLYHYLLPSPRAYNAKTLCTDNSGLKTGCYASTTGTISIGH